MADNTGEQGGDGEGDKGTDKFDPKSLSTEAQEYIRRTVQSESDTKTAVETKRLKDEQVSRTRQATEQAEQNELTQLAESGDFEALGQRVATQLSRRGVEETAVVEASNLIEKQVADSFTETLGAAAVERIRGEVAASGGAHAEFAQALAKEAGSRTKSEEIQAEVKAQLITAGVLTRDAVSGPDAVTGSGQGQKPSTWDEIEAGYGAGTVDTDVYEAAKKIHEASG